MKGFIYLLGIVFCLFSCQQREQTVSDSESESIDSRLSKSDTLDAIALDLSITEYLNMSDEVKNMRRASLIMAQYITLDREHRKYSVDISQAQALELGVSKADYERIASEIETFNKALIDMPEINTDELPDLKLQYKEYKERVDSLSSQKGL